MTEYIVKNGETITDVILNSTGNLDNWEAILEANDFDTWTPSLMAGDVIIIPDTVIIQPNNLSALSSYPANNGSPVPDLDAKVSDLIGSIRNWFLPSRDELHTMYSELKAHGLGDFGGWNYWSSSESSSSQAWVVNFTAGVMSDIIDKVNEYGVRACRKFPGVTGDYSIRDIGPAGGYIFYFDGANYYEAAPADQSTGYQWSNIVNAAIGTTGTSVGSGKANSVAIINQAGHTDSAAELCRSLTL